MSDLFSHPSYGVDTKKRPNENALPPLQYNKENKFAEKFENQQAIGNIVKKKQKLNEVNIDKTQILSNLTDKVSYEIIIIQDQNERKQSYERTFLYDRLTEDRIKNVNVEQRELREGEFVWVLRVIDAQRQQSDYLIDMIVYRIQAEDLLEMEA